MMILKIEFAKNKCLSTIWSTEKIPVAWTYPASKAVVGGPASAGPLFWPNMLSPVSLFCRFSRFCRACDLIPSKVLHFIDKIIINARHGSCHQ